MYIRKLYKLSSTPFHRRLLTGSVPGQQRLQHIVMSVKAYSGVLHVKELDAQNVELSAMKNVKIY